MKLVSYDDGGSWVAGILIDDRVVNAADVASAALLSGDHSSVRAIISADTSVRESLAAAAAEHVDRLGRARSELTLGPPIPDAEKILCIGLNYQSHVEEAKNVAGAPKDKQAVPVVFCKFATCLVGDGADVVMALGDDHVDFESELAVVIGKTATKVGVEDAMDHVAGYMPFNDVSARQLQLRSPQWTMGKAFDTSGPCGPALVTADEIDDPHALSIEGRLNGETVQSASTGEMLYTVADLIAFISSEITLNPGDIIATGTPAGVGIGREPQLWLKPGDTFEVIIEGLGTLTNKIVAPTGRPNERPAAVGAA